LSIDDFAEQLAAAAITRPTIEHAKGILMLYRRQNAEQAFADLVRASQTHNVKLAAIAEALTQVVAGDEESMSGRMRTVIATQWVELLQADTSRSHLREA
jgi:hypothetical protein